MKKYYLQIVNQPGNLIDFNRSTTMFIKHGRKKRKMNNGLIFYEILD